MTTGTPNICFVVGDLGSAKEMIPVAVELEKRDILVKWFADPKGKAGSDLLAKKNISFSDREPMTDKPDLILVGTSASANGLQVAWTKFGRERKIPVGWLEDLWGTGERLNSREVDPDFMLVNDEVAAQIAKNVRPNLETIVVGKATFENLAPLVKNANEIRARTRQALDVHDEEILVTYWSGGEKPDRVQAHLEAILQEMIFLSNYSMALAARLHPKLPEAFKEQCGKMMRDSGVKILESGPINPAELNIASNGVVADWSGTEGYAAMLVGTPVGITMFPEDADRLNSVGYSLGVPPLIMANAATSLNKRESVIEYFIKLIAISQNDRLDLSYEVDGRDKFVSLLVPGASSRIADAVMSRLGKK